MNKWMKQSMTGLILATAAAGIISEAKEQAVIREISTQNIDTIDLVGGSKLKDRMIIGPQGEQLLSPVRVVVQA